MTLYKRSNITRPLEAYSGSNTITSYDNKIGQNQLYLSVVASPVQHFHQHRRLDAAQLMKRGSGGFHFWVETKHYHAWMSAAREETQTMDSPRFQRSYRIHGERSVAGGEAGGDERDPGVVVSSASLLKPDG